MADEPEKPEAEDEEPEEVTGFLMTHVICTCGETVEVEGDASGDTIECDVCDQKLKVSRVM